MLNWFRQWRINRLLLELASTEARAKRLDESGYLAATSYARVEWIKEKLRQLGHVEEKKTLVRVGLPTNYLKKMLDEANKIAGEQGNG